MTADWLQKLTLTKQQYRTIKPHEKIDEDEHHSLFEYENE
jgi:hypothetical protein